ncbi:MAG: molybdenum cofactor biosynthesis protein MoaE [Bacteroidales bacterium]|nr:molybdenum cofactor biosynthesis protein MoaE [Bacteroidales bacterium]
MKLVNGPLSPGLIAEIIAGCGENHDTGGHALFLGQVRKDRFEGRYVKAIEYSAYEEMVIMEANKISKTILSEFEDVKIFEIIHSKGLVKAGEISLMVMVSAGHRQQALNACSKAVEMIKEKLPVWKKELYDDDSGQWKQNE